HAVADGELNLVLGARVDHALAFLFCHGHRLFAPDMLSGFRSANGVLSVHGGWQHDIDHVDIRVVGDAVEVIVVVNVLVGNVVLFLPGLGFGWCARHDAG